MAVQAPEGISPAERITLTLPVINMAKCVLFLLSGSEKEKIVQSILSDPDAASRSYPAAMVKPVGRLLWLIGGEEV